LTSSLYYCVLVLERITTIGQPLANNVEKSAKRSFAKGSEETTKRQALAMPGYGRPPPPSFFLYAVHQRKRALTSHTTHLAMASMSAVRRSLRQVATVAARGGAAAPAQIAAPARAIVAGEFRAQVREI
jgi:hypothetical protein